MQSSKNAFARRCLAFLAIAAVVVLFASCLPGDGKNSADKPANFLTGIWHGWIAPLSLIVGIFKGNIRIYEPNNNGWWYDFGFYMTTLKGMPGRPAPVPMSLTTAPPSSPRAARSRSQLSSVCSRRRHEDRKSVV